MDPKQLEYFRLLYQNGSITQTADSLYITRQALSLSLRKLEQELGRTLFRRTKNGMIPTRAAKLLFDYTQKQQALWNCTLRQIRETEPENSLRLAMHVMYYTAEQIQSFKEFYKIPGGCRIQILNVTDAGRCQTLLEEGRADMALTHKPANTARLQSLKFADAKACLLMRKDDPLSERERIDFTSDLKGRNCIFVSMETLREVEPLLTAQGALGSFLDSDRILVQQSLSLDGSLMVIPDPCLKNFLAEELTARELVNFPVVNGSYFLYERETPEILCFCRYLRGEISP